MRKGRSTIGKFPNFTVPDKAQQTMEETGADLDSTSLVEEFHSALDQHPDGMSDAVAAIKVLLETIKRSEAGTIAGLRDEIKMSTKALIEAKTSTVSVSSGCELFVRFITLTSKLEEKDFQELKGLLIKRGQTYLQTVASSRQKIAKIVNPFLRDGTTVLIHSISKVVYWTLRQATESRKRLKVFITTCALDQSGITMQKWLQDSNIPSKIILDSAIGFVMEKVDLVMVGAEGVAESGGIINKIGTYQLAVMAKALNKPFYVVAESFKFVRMYPLNQDDLPNVEKYSSVDSSAEAHPHIDYTPPHYITLLFTDLGVLTPSAVSDELIKLYQ